MTDWPFAAPKGVEIVNAASHDALMREAAVVVTHAGHGTTLRALRAGAPIVAMPMGRDQNENAARVEYHGAGLRLGPDAAVEDIAGAITRVVREPSFATRARALADAIAGEGDGAERFADEIETLAEVQSPPTPIGV